MNNPVLGRIVNGFPFLISTSLVALHFNFMHPLEQLHLRAPESRLADLVHNRRLAHPRRRSRRRLDVKANKDKSSANRKSIGRIWAGKIAL